MSLLNVSETHLGVSAPEKTSQGTTAWNRQIACAINVRLDINPALRHYPNELSQLVFQTP